LQQENWNTQKTKTETELVAIFWREKKRQKIATRNSKNKSAFDAIILTRV